MISASRLRPLHPVRRVRCKTPGSLRRVGGAYYQRVRSRVQPMLRCRFDYSSCPPERALLNS